jgi:hypothetical protein
MTEAEWLACADPMPMLKFLQGKTSDRKLRLFAVGCCRGIWHLIRDKECRRAVEVAELHADGEASDELLSHSCSIAEAILDDASTDGLDPHNPNRVSACIAEAVAFAVWHTTFLARHHEEETYGFHVGAVESIAETIVAAVEMSTKEDARLSQAHLLRDIYGIVSRTVTFSSSWLVWNDGIIRKLAQAIYQERAFDHLPILADALEDAGCDNADILTHCRSGGEHVRGCWVIDLLLGKE